MTITGRLQEVDEGPRLRHRVDFGPPAPGFVGSVANSKKPFGSGQRNLGPLGVESTLTCVVNVAGARGGFDPVRGRRLRVLFANGKAELVDW